MTFQRVFSGAPWERSVGYCRALRAGDRIFVTGTAPVAPGGAVHAPGDAKLTLGTAGMLETVNGQTLTFGADGTTVNGVEVVCSDVTTANATVHIIGSVLFPA